MDLFGVQIIGCHRLKTRRISRGRSLRAQRYGGVVLLKERRQDERVMVGKKIWFPQHAKFIFI